MKAYLALELFLLSVSSQIDKTAFLGDELQSKFLWTVLLDIAISCVLVKGGHSKSTWLLHLLRGRPSAQNMCLGISTFFWVRNISVSEALSFYRRFSNSNYGRYNCFMLEMLMSGLHNFFKQGLYALRLWQLELIILHDPQILWQIVFAWYEIIKWLTD